MTLNDIRALVADDLERVDQILIDNLQSDVALVNQLGHYIVNAGGKRLRPLLVLLSAGASGYQGKADCTMAAVIELIHTATLLHDDVVDASDMRRGQETANALFGNEASVLVGDFLYSRAFQLMVGVNAMPIMELMAQTTNMIAAGEVLQLMNCNDPDVTEARYLEVIENKTAILFAAATKLGGILAKQPGFEQPLHDYGLQLGVAFQLMDDILDYTADSEAMGKNVGDDLAEGKPTLPLIIALQRANGAEQELIRQAIDAGGVEHLEEVIHIVERTHALDYCREAAEVAVKKAKKSLLQLPDSDYAKALSAIAELSLKRDH